MAIIRKAANIKIITHNRDSVLAGNIHMNSRKKMIFDAIEDNLEFNSVKKIKADGRG
ncbi:hypothetical protein [Chryseobacterium aureum]|jgi:hypothetical protein|uniref:hypothetical protein n=1 Tax=Chryseobacterium aureum TaxID=2497456 RepID=UPI0013E08840|nr:hypothetical protein [Chryseobacterium aureum]